MVPVASRMMMHAAPITSITSTAVQVAGQRRLCRSCLSRAASGSGGRLSTRVILYQPASQRLVDTPHHDRASATASAYNQNKGCLPTTSLACEFRAVHSVRASNLKVVYSIVYVIALMRGCLQGSRAEEYIRRSRKKHASITLKHS